MKETIWRTAECLDTLRKQINRLAPNRKKSSDGTIGDTAHSREKSDHNAWIKEGKTGIVTAIDITNDPDNGCDAQKIVNALIESRDTRIKYIIWHGQIINSKVQPWVWRKYSGLNPHNEHFHLSVMPEKELYDSTNPWHIQ